MRALYEADDWGHLPGYASQQVACARIASSISSLTDNSNSTFKLSEIHNASPEFVRIVRTLDGNLLRQSVQKDE
jgi:hypothetical protein